MAGDPVVARLSTDNLVTNAGGRAWYEFRFTANEANGRSFTLSSPGAGSFTFTFRTVPDPNSPTDLPLQGALTQTLWLQQIRRVLESNFNLTQHYTVVDTNNSGPAIRLDAIQPGTTFQITGSTGTCVNFALVASSSGANRAVRPNFRLLVETFVRQNLNFRKKGSGDLIAVDADGVALAQVEAYLEERPSQQFAWPPLPINPASFRNQLANAAYMRWAESYGIPEQVQRLNRSDEFVVLQGRLPNKRKVTFYNQFANWPAYFEQTKRFLTWQPLVKEIFSDQPEKLYWFHFYENAPTFKIRVRRVLADGTSSVIEHLTGLTGTPFWVTEIETSVSVLAPGIANLAELHVWVANAANAPLSATQVYIIKPRPAHVQYFFFENSFGAFDTVAFTGHLTEEDDYQVEQEEVYAPSSYRAAARRSRRFRNNQGEEFTTHSGFTTNDEFIDWLDDLLNSPAPYEVVNNQLHDIAIESGKVFKRRTEEFVKAITFSYKRLAPIQVFRTVVPGILNAPPTVDPDVPAPSFPAQLVPGLAGQEELYFPGNTWLNIPNAAVNQSDAGIIMVFRPDSGNITLLSDSQHSTRIRFTDGLDTMFIRNDNSTSEVEIPLGASLQGIYIMLELVVTGLNYRIRINGSIISEGSFPSGSGITFRQFGRKSEGNNFVGRLVNLELDASERLESGELRMRYADIYGIAVDGAQWLTSLEPELQQTVIDGRFTRDQVLNKEILNLPRTAVPSILPASGTYPGPLPVTIQSVTPDAVVHFTTNLSDPTIASPIAPPSLILTDDATIKAFAVAPGYLPSAIVSRSYLVLQDPDVALFVQNAQITNVVIQQAVRQLFTTWKSAGIWNECRVAYLYTGGNGAAHALNARNPANTDAAFRQLFVGGWVHNNQGAFPNGTNAFARTFANAAFYNTGTGLSMFTLLASPKIGTNVQAIAGAFDPLVLIDHNNDSIRYYAGNATAPNIAQPNGVGFWGWSRRRNNTGGNQFSFFNQLGAVVTITDTSPTTIAGWELYVAARNSNNVAQLFSTQLTQFFFLGNNLTQAQMETLRSSVLLYNEIVRAQ